MYSLHFDPNTIPAATPPTAWLMGPSLCLSSPITHVVPANTAPAPAKKKKGEDGSFVNVNKNSVLSTVSIF